MTEEKINHIVDDLSAKLIRNKIGEKAIKTIILDSSIFNNEYISERNVTTCPEHSEKFKELFDIKKPVLYWFEFDPAKVSKETLRKKYSDYADYFKKRHDDENYRNTAAYKKDYSQAEKTLYVGKVKDGFWGRLVTHLGYNKSIKTAGMQLFHWYDPKEYGNLALNYVVLDKDMANLVTVLEMEMAQRLKPIIGKY